MAGGVMVATRRPPKYRVRCARRRSASSRCFHRPRGAVIGHEVVPQLVKGHAIQPRRHWRSLRHRALAQLEESLCLLLVSRPRGHPHPLAGAVVVRRPVTRTIRTLVERAHQQFPLSRASRAACAALRAASAAAACPPVQRTLGLGHRVRGAVCPPNSPLHQSPVLALVPCSRRRHTLPGFVYRITAVESCSHDWRPPPLAFRSRLGHQAHPQPRHRLRNLPRPGLVPRHRQPGHAQAFRGLGLRPPHRVDLLPWVRGPKAE
jgi:hypothetical protein